MQRTPVAVLGTLAEFHCEPIPYDLNALVQLVTDLRPELLCLDMTGEQWSRRSFGDVPPEYREALLPLAYQTDIVVAPIAGAYAPQEPTAAGWRGRFIAHLRGWLAQLHRAAPHADAVNSGVAHWAADMLYEIILLLTDRRTRHAWRAHTRRLARNALDIVRRDPDATVLIVVNVRHCHHLRRYLRKSRDVCVVPYRQLPALQRHDEQAVAVVR
ncbi:MAG: hypothetical protein M3R24_05100 [Chloroflexota bacterium]|nr:hypothetical protein [Chloroflexota bacterium]